MSGTLTAEPGVPPPVTGGPAPEGEQTRPRRPRRRGERQPFSDRRRFTVAVLVGGGVMVLPLLWILWDLWSGSVDTLRGVGPDTFYDFQARAMFHGHFYLQNGALGIEAFEHAGHQYTYFGIFPSLIRMPVLAVTDHLDGMLTAPSLLVAWVCTGLFSALLLWRLRVVIRKGAALGRAEAASFGLLMAAILGGSVIIYVAATPFVYSEDFAWSVPLTLGSIFGLLGMMERPSMGRAVFAGLLILCTNLNRTPAGYACVIGAGLVCAWFALGRAGADKRRWAIPMIPVAVIPFLASCAVTYAKFGLPIGLPMADQVWAHVNAHRRYFLAANGGKAFSFGFLPSTMWAYLQPFGLHLSGIFPFFSTPTAPAAALGDTVLDQTYPTASAPATMPLFVGLGIWGLIAAFRKKSSPGIRLTRIVLVTGLLGCAGVLLWGYISERYMDDLMPVLILAGGVGLIDIWRRLERHQARPRRIAFGVIAVVALYCVVVNLALAISPEKQWTATQTSRFLSLQQTLGPGSLASTVQRGTVPPYWAPAGQLFIAGDCTGLYLSSGETFKDVPGQQIEHYSWMPVEQSSRFTHEIWFTFNGPASQFTQPVTLMTYGSSRLVLEPVPASVAKGRFWVQLVDSGTTINWPLTKSLSKPISVLHEPFRIGVTIDPNLKSMFVDWYGSTLLQHYIGGSGPAIVQTTHTPAGAPLPEVTVAEHPPPPTDMSLCRGLEPGP